jgi:16S rRNA (uracil1498-N3)-methyltransferase
MRIPRLHVPQPLFEGATLDLRESATRHVRTVLRLKSGADLVVFDGEGNAHDGTLQSMNRDAVRVSVGMAQAIDVESPLAVTLALGISRGERMDLAIQKSVELGVAAIVPLVTERSVVRLDAQRAARRREHWQEVAVSACEQCGRNRVPPVSPVTPIDQWLAAGEFNGLKLLPDPRAEAGLNSVPGAGTSGVTLLIGPEGGISDAERTLALGHGFMGVRLGPRVLRTETAVIAALACVMNLWGDLGS